MTLVPKLVHAVPHESKSPLVERCCPSVGDRRESNPRLQGHDLPCECLYTTATVRQVGIEPTPLGLQPSATTRSASGA